MVQTAEDVVKAEDVAGLMEGRYSRETGSRAMVMAILLLLRMVRAHQRLALREEEATATACIQELYCRE